MIFFFKQKTAYEMRISDWSSDVCSSDLRREHARGQRLLREVLQRHHRLGVAADQIADRFLEAGGVRHDVTQRDRLAVIGRNLEIEIGVDVLVEVELARLDLLHEDRKRYV